MGTKPFLNLLGPIDSSISKSNSDRESLYFSAKSSSLIYSGVFIFHGSSTGCSLNVNEFVNFLFFPISTQVYLAMSVNEVFTGSVGTLVTK
jgi:hypothetical protein